MSKTTAGSKKTNLFRQTNPLETDRQSAGVVKTTTQTFKDIGAGMFDQLMGNYDDDDFGQEYAPREHTKKNEGPQRKEFTVFSGLEHKEKVQIKHEIEQLQQEIKQMQKIIKNADAALSMEMNDIEKVALNDVTESIGIYHVRFMETILQILRTLREKISESNTWLTAMTSKKKKRGSLFAARTKKQGTQYSLSQEISNARSVQ